MDNAKAPRNEVNFIFDIEKVRVFLTFSASIMVVLTAFILSSGEVHIYSMPTEPIIIKEVPIARVGNAEFIEVIKKEIPKKAHPIIVQDNETEEETKESVDINTIIAEISPDMDISHVSGISKEDFVWAMKNYQYDYNGVLADLSEEIWEKCNEENIHEFFIIALIGGESGWCDSELAWKKKNIMSVKNDYGEYKEYSSYLESVLDGIRLISEEYINENGDYATGGKISDIGATYAPDNPVWASKIAEYMEMCTKPLKERDSEEA